MEAYNILKRRKKKKRPYRTGWISGATNAILGVALVSTTADAIKRL